MNTSFIYKNYEIIILEDSEVTFETGKMEIIDLDYPDIVDNHTETVEEAIKYIDEKIQWEIDTACALPVDKGVSSTRKQNAMWNVLWPEGFGYCVWVSAGGFMSTHEGSYMASFYKEFSDVEEAIAELKQLCIAYRVDVYKWEGEPVLLTTEWLS